MRRSRYHNRAQLVLELERQLTHPVATKRAKGLVEALADLLLEAMAADRTQGGEDEREDHA